MCEVYLNDLVIELGRTCNFRCAHCLRGESQSVTFNTDYLKTLLKSISGIGILILTGGEPTLYMSVVREIFEILKDSGISIGFGWFSTNGSNLNEALEIYMGLFKLSENKEYVSMQISDSIYHHDFQTDSVINNMNTLSTILKNCTISSESNPENLISMGFALDNGIGYRDLEESNFELEDDVVNSIVYLNSLGEIYNNCDLSYDVQDSFDHSYLCNVNDFNKIIKNYSE